MRTEMSIPFLHGTFDMAFGILFGGGVTLIVQFFTFAKTYFQLCPPVDEIYAQRNDGAPLLFYLGIKPAYLFFVHQQSFRTLGLCISLVAQTHFL